MHQYHNSKKKKKKRRREKKKKKKEGVGWEGLGSEGQGLSKGEVWAVGGANAQDPQCWKRL